MYRIESRYEHNTKLGGPQWTNWFVSYKDKHYASEDEAKEMVKHYKVLIKERKIKYKYEFNIVKNED